eukprot:3789640-Karenia_brevis.AAC.1
MLKSEDADTEFYADPDVKDGHASSVLFDADLDKGVDRVSERMKDFNFQPSGNASSVLFDTLHDMASVSLKDFTSHHSAKSNANDFNSQSQDA